jgi:O-antigen/teichoic acid export membrane protein
MILFCGVLLWGNIGDLKMTIKGFVYAQTLSYFISLLVALTAVLVHSKGFAFKLDFPFSKAIIKKSIPYALLVLLMTLYTKIDVVMIERMLPDGKTQAGIYAQGYRILEASNMIAFLFAGLLLPMFSKMLSNNEDVKQLVYLASKLLLYPSVVLVFCAVLFSNEIMELLYSYNTSEAAKVFGVLIVSFLPIASIYIYGTLLTAKGNLKFLNQVSLITLMLNVALNFYLIPAYGAYGAAQATLATQGLAALLQVGYAFKSFELQLSKEWILKIAILLLLCAVVAHFQETIQLAWGARLFVMIFIFAVYGFLGKFINIKDLHTILNEKR